MSKYNTGGAVDTRIPIKAIELLNKHGLATAEFVEWFGSKLGRYRDYSSPEPGIPEQVDDMRKLADQMMQVRNGLQVGAISSAGDAYANETMRKVYGEFYFDLARRLEQDLLRASTVLSHAADELTGHARRGPPTKKLMNELLASLVDKLRKAGATTAVAREVAPIILRECGIVSAYSERGVRRATRSVEK